MAKAARLPMTSLPLASKTPGRRVENHEQPPETEKKVTVITRVTPAERKALRQIALNRNVTLQSVVEDLFRDLINNEIKR